MKQILISDITLKENEYSFKEKIEIAKQLDKLNVDVIEVPAIKNKKTDILFLHTVAPLLKNSILACTIGFDENLIKLTNDALSGSNSYRLRVEVPVSIVQMEYMCHKKPKFVSEMIEKLVSKCKKCCENVEFAALDATRSEFDFLCSSIKIAIAAGANVITVCDSAGTMLPVEFEEFIKNLYENIEELKNVTLSVSCSNELNMASACAIAAINAGADEIKTTVNDVSFPSLGAISHIISSRGDSMSISTKLINTAIKRSIEKMMFLNDSKRKNQLSNTTVLDNDGVILTNGDDIKAVSAAVKKIGYDLSEDDLSKVFDEFCRVAAKKQISAKELDAIIASVSLQVPPTYKLKSFVVNNGNIISATAQIELEKNGEKIFGVAIGDGPIDAAFMAIEQNIGTHYELDDFQIQSVTEGQEAVANAIVKLRSNGKLYSGRGVSQDIIGASIYAYLSAINKICFEEE